MQRTITVFWIAASCGVLGAIPAANATIRPGVGLAHVKLGMILAQTKRELGKPQTVNARLQLAGHRGYIEYGWNYSSTWVGFINTRGVCAVLIGTNLVREKTARESESGRRSSVCAVCRGCRVSPKRTGSVIRTSTRNTKTDRTVSLLVRISDERSLSSGALT